MKKQLILFILLFCYFSCASQKKEIIAKSTIKLEGINTNIRDLIEIDGYYYMKEYEEALKYFKIALLAYPDNNDIQNKILEIENNFK